MNSYIYYTQMKIIMTVSINVIERNLYVLKNDKNKISEIIFTRSIVVALI